MKKMIAVPFIWKYEYIRVTTTASPCPLLLVGVLACSWELGISRSSFTHANGLEL